MKRRRLRAALSALLLLLASCAPSDGQPPAGGNAVAVYYLDKAGSSQSSVVPESHSVPAGLDPVEYAAALLFDAPRSDELKVPFPDNVELLGVTVESGTATVNLSAQYASMSGIALSLADACVTHTLGQFSEISHVRILSDGHPHPHREDRTAEAGDYLLEALRLEPYDVALSPYFAAASRRYVVRELQNITLRENDLAPYMIEMLIGGPQTEGLLPVIPEGTRLITLTVEESVCFVSFSDEFVTAAEGDAASARMTLVALANSLTGLEGIERVKLSIDGDPLDRYFMYDISGGLVREQDAILSTSQGIEVNLYYLDASRSLVPIAANIDIADLADIRLEKIRTYLTRQTPIGLKRPIPDNVEVLSLVTEGRIAKLDLSAALSDSMAPYALLSILSDNSTIDGLYLYHQGKPVNETPYTLEDINGKVE